MCIFRQLLIFEFEVFLKVLHNHYKHFELYNIDIGEVRSKLKDSTFAQQSRLT